MFIFLSQKEKEIYILNACAKFKDKAIRLASSHAHNHINKENV